MSACSEMYIHVILLATLMKVCHSLLLGSCLTSQSSLNYWPSLLSFFRLIQGLVHDLCLLHKNWTERKEGPCHITHISNARMFMSDPSNSFVNFNLNKLLTLSAAFAFYLLLTLLFPPISSNVCMHTIDPYSSFWSYHFHSA